MSLRPIEVRRHGDEGPPVVVLHGGPGAPGSAVGMARALGSDCRVFEPLQRRSGETPLTVARHVVDLAEIAPEYAAYVGASWGAMLALSFAARHPERVRSIALVGCGTYDEPSRQEYRRAMSERLSPADRPRIEALTAELVAEPSPAARDRLFAEFVVLATRAQAYELIEDFSVPLPVDYAGHDETWNDALRLQREGIEPAAFRAVHAPTLMLHGTDDPHPGPATRDLLRKHVPHLEYESLPRCGHEPWREVHARTPFLARLREWAHR